MLPHWLTKVKHSVWGLFEMHKLGYKFGQVKEPFRNLNRF